MPLAAMVVPSAVAASRHDVARPSREPQNTQIRFMPIGFPVVSMCPCALDERRAR